MVRSNVFSGVTAKNDAFLAALSFMCQGVPLEYAFALLKARHYFFLFFFLEHLVSFFNLFCLLMVHGYSIDYIKAILIGMRWRPTARGYGKLLNVERLEPRRYFFIGMFGTKVLLELQSFKGLHFTLFNAEFFYKPKRKRVYYLMNRFWWYGFGVFLWLKSYIFFMAIVRYNHYIEGVHAGAKPLLRGAAIWKLRFESRTSARDYKMRFFEYFGIFLYFGRFVFFKDRGSIAVEGKGRKAKAVAEEDGAIFIKELTPHRLIRSTHFVSLQDRRFSELFCLPERYFGSLNFWMYAGYYYLYFAHRHIQGRPRRFMFARTWVQRWLSLPIISSMWRSIYLEFIDRFMKDLLKQYVIFLATGSDYVDSSFTEAMLLPLLNARGFFELVDTAFYDINLLDYGLDDLPRGAEDFAAFFINSVYVFEFWDQGKRRWVDQPTRVEDTEDKFILYFALLEFLEDELFVFTAVEDMLPFSYFLYIQWKGSNPYMFNSRFAKLSDLWLYFKRLHLDAFFFYRFRSFIHNIAGQLFFLRLLAKGPTSSRDAVVPIRAKGLRFKQRIFYYFHVRDLVFKSMFIGEILPLYLFYFNFFYSHKLRRLLFTAFGSWHYCYFRLYFVRKFLHYFVGPWGSEPTVFYDPVYNKAINTRFKALAARREDHATIGVGKARLSYKDKWYPLIPAFRGDYTSVEVHYLEEPGVTADNWEYAYSGMRLPHPLRNEEAEKAEKLGLLELRLSFYYMVFGK